MRPNLTSGYDIEIHKIKQTKCGWYLRTSVPKISSDQNIEIGFVFLAIGAAFYSLGVLMLFNQAFLILGNVSRILHYLAGIRSGRGLLHGLGLGCQALCQ